MVLKEGKFRAAEIAKRFGAGRTSDMVLDCSAKVNVACASEQVGDRLPENKKAPTGLYNLLLHALFAINCFTEILGPML